MNYKYQYLIILVLVLYVYMLLCISVKLDIWNNKQGPVVKTLYIGKLTDISATEFLKMKRKFYLCNKIFITIDSKHKTI